MSNDLISKKALINALFVRNGKMCPDTDIDNFPITINVKDVKKAIRNAPTAYDVDKVVERLEELREMVPVNRLLDDIIKDKPKELGQLVAYRKAIEIVKSGGIE